MIHGYLAHSFIIFIQNYKKLERSRHFGIRGVAFFQEADSSIYMIYSLFVLRKKLRDPASLQFFFQVHYRK